MNARANFENAIKTAIRAAHDLGLTNDEIIEALEDAAAEIDPRWEQLRKFAEDPTPWCLACGSMTQEGCRCGPIADHD